jgi:hypothetical protein
MDFGTLPLAYRLRRHPIPMTAWLRHSLVLTYALPAGVLAPLLPPGLVLDTYRGYGFVAVALVQTERLRPSGLPVWLGRDYFLTGYRLFVRHRGPAGRQRRGLHILRSQTDRRSMVIGGNALTHYNYRLAKIGVDETAEQIEVRIRTRTRAADLHVIAELTTGPAPLPSGSPFSCTADARRFAGPLPWTFDYEPETRSIIMIHGRRRDWDPHSVAVRVLECSFFEHGRLAGTAPILANAFHVGGVDYRWARGVRVPLATPSQTPSQAPLEAPCLR